MTPYRFHLTIVVSLLLTGVAWYLVSTSTDFYNAARFNRRVDELQTSIQFRMQTYINALTQTKSAFGITDINREQFKAYIADMGLLENYPGIQGIGYALRITPESLNEHIDSVRREGFPDYTVWPETPRDEYYSIVYLEPFDWRNQRAFGYDMFTEPVRRAAMVKARDTGKPATTGKVTLVQETDIRRQPGFLIYIPVYTGGLAPNTVEERREALQGFVYSPFRALDLYQSVLDAEAGTAPTIDFQIYDGSVSSDTLLFDYDETPDVNDSFDPRFKTQLQLEVAGRDWTLVVSNLPGFDLPWTRFAPSAILAVGAAITLLLLTLMRSNQKEREANAKTASLLKQLESQNADLEIINRVGRSLSAQLELDKLAQSITDAATTLCKAEFGALFYTAADEEGEPMMLYTLSGAARETFAKFPPPRQTAIFRPTFSGEGVVRSDDITKHEGYGKNPPFFGMPEGHPPVVSYLAVPVVSRSGKAIGGLFFGHKEAGVFTEREEKLIVGIASQAAIAIDNAGLYQQAQQAIQTRDDFLSIASHEFRSPLSTLSMQLQIFQRMNQSPDMSISPAVLNEGLDACQRQVARLVVLVEDLLDVAQIEAGRLSYRYEETDLIELTKTVLEYFSSSHENVECGLQLEVSGPLIIECDRFRIEQVIMNLLTNAMKYGEGSPIQVTVAVTNDQHALVKVTDTGIGIDKVDQLKIFERFQRAVPHRNIGGFGLGLFISKQIIDAHGGSIEVESAVGQGSTFSIYLPRNAARSASDDTDLAKNKII